MRFLFLHQNFPGQFRHVAGALADHPGHEVVGIGDARNAKAAGLHPRLKVVTYPSPKPGGQHTHHYLRDSESHLRRGQQVVRTVMQLKKQGFIPDVVVAHSGWGEALFLRQLLPSARHIHYCEFFYHAEGCDLGFDPEFPCTPDDRFKVGIRNSTQLLCLPQCDAGISPTQWQQSLYPPEYRSRITLLHEGIDTGKVRPDPLAVLRVQNRQFSAGDEIVTFVARNLEPYRGFHLFMRALPLMQALRPTARFLIAGGDEVSYGRALPQGESYRQKYQAELDGLVDWSKVHFVGKLPYAEYLKLLQVSAVHVYLTYPFVLSWSMLEAMASGCLVVGSATPPVQEVITHGENGLLVNFFDTEGLARQVATALADPEKCKGIRIRARHHVQQHYDLHTRCLPAWLRFLAPQTYLSEAQPS